MPGGHEEHIREAFTAQAETFEDERLNTAFTAGLPWLLEYVAARPDDVVLDVAAGTGIVSRALAPGVARVTAVDTTPAMIEEGRRRAAEEGVHNLAFVAGSAEDLPFPSAAFTLVVTRFSLHHFLRPAPPLVEMVRVLRPGGRLVVKDLVASDDPETAARQDRVERLRDPSHRRMPPRRAVSRWVEYHGLRVEAVGEREVDRPLGPWLEQAVTDPESAALVRETFETELSGGTATGMRPHRDAGEVWFHQRWEVTVARKP